MDDSEINKRVAEIEGWRPNHYSDYPSSCWWFRNDEAHGNGPPPYATEWAWIGPVLEKAISKYGTGFMERVDVLMYDEDRPLKQAICLAWIAAHEGKG